ncbi:divalent-cation tolerance protein CutA [Microbispora hainanensis]|uniref:Divalent-cation tolerance protein CutA n=1 Tax=Microbispora hainanensis TaxID=568844 RepID=A0A544YV82_9ACTN|nr:divalent-cation tolerance protein CutA [Microbispora hainanensis]TQS20676.1 divalent-cation tolerance protein CutA [Microbispora hainanensis]
MRQDIEVRVTASSRDEADRIALAVVTCRLAACAQVVAPISSTYWWAGEVQQAEEWLLLMKTTADRFEDLAACVRELHSYEVPEIVAVPIVQGTPDYLEWIRRETAPERGE